jgi:hypothetical protein
MKAGPVLGFRLRSRYFLFLGSPCHGGGRDQFLGLASPLPVDPEGISAAAVKCEDNRVFAAFHQGDCGGQNARVADGVKQAPAVQIECHSAFGLGRQQYVAGKRRFQLAPPAAGPAAAPSRVVAPARIEPGDSIHLLRIGEIRVLVPDAD